MLFFYIRHGDPIYDPDSLTELGQQQAQALVARMREANPGRIFASSSVRAQQTAMPTASALGIEIETLDWCHEDYAWRDFADVYPGREEMDWLWRDPAMRRLLVSPQVQQLGRAWWRHPGLERYQAGVQRVQQETDKLMLSLGYRHHAEQGGYVAERPNDDRVALFAHEGFGLIFLSCLLDIPYPLFATHFGMSHTGMTVIQFSGEGLLVPNVLQLANDSHLFAAGMQPLYQNQIRF